MARSMENKSDVAVDDGVRGSESCKKYRARAKKRESERKSLIFYSFNFLRVRINVTIITWSNDTLSAIAWRIRLCCVVRRSTSTDAQPAHLSGYAMLSLCIRPTHSLPHDTHDSLWCWRSRQSSYTAAAASPRIRKRMGLGIVGVYCIREKAIQPFNITIHKIMPRTRFNRALHGARVARAPLHKYCSHKGLAKNVPILYRQNWKSIMQTISEALQKSFSMLSKEAVDAHHTHASNAFDDFRRRRIRSSFASDRDEMNER